jgi:hypothetical protein
VKVVKRKIGNFSLHHLHKLCERGFFWCEKGMFLFYRKKRGDLFILVLSLYILSKYAVFVTGIFFPG